MIRPATQSSDPFLKFTKDFHELVSGRLERGRHCTISYDPDRIVPDGDPYWFGDPNRPVTAFLQFVFGGPVTELTLQSTSGVMQFATTTLQGIGPTLKAEFVIPADAQWIKIWFKFINHTGGEEFDSDFGRNFTFRFLTEDANVTHASVAHDPVAPVDKLWIRVEADATVTAINARYRVLNSKSLDERIGAALAKTGEANGKNVWELRNEMVPHGAVIQFDIEYWIYGERYKDNNQGSYFSAVEAE